MEWLTQLDKVLDRALTTDENDEDNEHHDDTYSQDDLVYPEEGEFRLPNRIADDDDEGEMDMSLLEDVESDLSIQMMEWNAPPPSSNNNSLQQVQQRSNQFNSRAIPSRVQPRLPGTIRPMARPVEDDDESSEYTDSHDSCYNPTDTPKTISHPQANYYNNSNINNREILESNNNDAENLGGHPSAFQIPTQVVTRTSSAIITTTNNNNTISDNHPSMFDDGTTTAIHTTDIDAESDMISPLQHTITPIINYGPPPPPLSTSLSYNMQPGYGGGTNNNNNNNNNTPTIPVAPLALPPPPPPPLYNNRPPPMSDDSSYFMSDVSTVTLPSTTQLMASTSSVPPPPPQPPSNNATFVNSNSSVAGQQPSSAPSSSSSFAQQPFLLETVHSHEPLIDSPTSLEQDPEDVTNGSADGTDLNHQIDLESELNSDLELQEIDLSSPQRPSQSEDTTIHEMKQESEQEAVLSSNNIISESKSSSQLSSTNQTKLTPSSKSNSYETIESEEPDVVANVPDVHAFQAAMGDFFSSNSYDSYSITDGRKGAGGGDEGEDDYDDMTLIEGVDYEMDAHLCIPWDMDNELELGSVSSPLQSSQTSQPSMTTSNTIHPPQQSTFRPEMNRHGIIHVRLIRAQRLRCTDGSLLQANISLPPWKGRIRSEKVTAYHGPSSADICVRWDEKEHWIQQQQQQPEVDVGGDASNGGEGLGIVDGGMEDDVSLLDDGDPTNLMNTSGNVSSTNNNNNATNTNTIPYHSMVHAYNNEDTPIPNIKVELKDLSYQMFEMDVCHLSLSCEPLMRHPGIFRRRWCPVEKSTGVSSSAADVVNGGEEEEENPTLVLIEACFEPTFVMEESKLIGNGSSGNGHLIDDDLEQPDHDGLMMTEQSGGLRGIGTTDTFDETSHTLQIRNTTNLISKPHLFRINSSWRPTYCAVCHCLVGIRTRGYTCEVCKLDCCADCQLRVDVDLPCGSEACETAVKKALESKITMNKIFAVMAPVKEVARGSRFSQEEKEREAGGSMIEKSNLLSTPKKALSRLTSFDSAMTKSSSEVKKFREGVGEFKFRVIKACLFQKHFNPEAELKDMMKHGDRWLRVGDHYARISWTGSTDSKRTKTVFQTAKPRFESEEMSITALNYGTEYRIEVLDATTDKPVGTALLTTQGLLQSQREMIAKEGSMTLSSVLFQEALKAKKIKQKIGLRSGVKSGFGLDFYNAGKPSDSSRAGEISGWIEIEMCFEEDPDLFSNSNPKKCTSRPPEDFNVDLIQLHITRIGLLVNDLSKIGSAYLYMVSWKDPTITSLSLILFVTLCLRFDAEYFGSLPLAILCCYMLYRACVRREESFKNRLIKKERNARQEQEKESKIRSKCHRPIGTLQVSVHRGKHLTPPHGIPGSLVSSVYWDPLRYVRDEKKRKELIKQDACCSTLHPIGTTESSGVTSTPVWEVMYESDELKRMKRLLPISNFLSRTGDEIDRNTTDDNQSLLGEVAKGTCVQFPILQPIEVGGEEADVMDEEGDITSSVRLIDWQSSPGAIVIQVHFGDVFNKLPLFDDILGEVIVPLSRLSDTNEINGWFKVLEKGTIHTIEGSDQNEIGENEKVKSATTETDTIEEEKDSSEAKQLHPEIYLNLKFSLPENDITDIQRETSLVVAEEMIRSSTMSQENRVGIIGTSISTFNTVRGVTGNVQYLQNQLSFILNNVEMLRNIFNFSCPEKSAFILICLSILWFVLILIPTRYLILLGGLAQYTVSFISMLTTTSTQPNDDDTALKDKDSKPDPMVTRMINFYSSIPTDEDLRRHYFWDSIKASERDRAVIAKRKRITRLRNLWNAAWFGKLELKVKSLKRHNSTNMDWEGIFAIIQGHRFIWWSSERHFDDGADPLGQIFFAGHSGLAGLSPLDLREMKEGEIPLVVCIFGRGTSSQQKITLLTPDIATKEKLEEAVLYASLDHKAD